MRNPSEKISYLIKAAENVFEAILPKGEGFTAEEIHEIVGGHVQALCTTRDGYIMFANEYGKSTTQIVNKHATRLYLQSVGEGPADFIVGDVLLCHKEHAV